MLRRAFPFVDWVKDLRPASLRADAIAGLTVALVLIPQSMAYAQLAGLPAHYGLYAAFLPPAVAALFGSSRQLATGPVAVVSLMTAAALEPLATPGSANFIAYAVVLSLVVGLFQLALGVLRFGVIVNFLSHPVVNGFTNAAALIIATSQLEKIFCVRVDKAAHHYETVWRVIAAAWHYTYWPATALAALAFAIMYGLKRVNPRLPFVLAAVVVAAAVSWAIGYERNARVPAASIRDDDTLALIADFNATVTASETAAEERGTAAAALEATRRAHGAGALATLEAAHARDVANLQVSATRQRAESLRARLRRVHLRRVVEADGSVAFFARGGVPEGRRDDGRCWRLRVGNTRLDTAKLPMMGGGEVVGRVPPGLPKLAMPRFSLETFLRFLSVAVVISLLGFMEAISIAKAMAAKTRQRLDPNQELIGQGVANIIGSFSLSYPVSGSFSRSAVNIGAGAVTGMSSVFTSLVVAIALLTLTPLLYHIPQSVLAAVIMMAVVGLINLRGFLHAYRVQRHDGIIAVVSFLCTLAFAPHLDKGIMIGVALSVAHYLYRNSRPALASLSLHPDRSLRSAERHGLRQCEVIAVIRFDGPLFFANATYLEDQINDKIKSMPRLRHVLLPANGINEIDASGEEALSLIIDRLRSQGLEISFSGLNESVRDVFRRTHLLEKVGEDHIFPTQAAALAAIHARAHEHADEPECPLLSVVYADPDRIPEGKPVVRDLRVLWVQDPGRAPESIARKLRRRGVRVTLVPTAGDAIARMEERFHEVVVVDQAPGGAELAELRRRWPEVALVQLTRDGEAAAAPDVQVLAWPHSLEHLLRAINRAAIGVRSERARRAQPASGEGATAV